MQDTESVWETVPISADPATSETRQFVPVTTQRKTACLDGGCDPKEIRTYKLGQNRWIYNEIRMSLLRRGQLVSGVRIKDATRAAGPEISPEFQECGTAFSCQLTNNATMRLRVYVGYDEPEKVTNIGEDRHNDSACLSSPRAYMPDYVWPAAQRSHCTCKGRCQGPILKPIMRYGRVSKRNKGKSLSGSPPISPDRAKDPQYLYLSIDEASSHVDNKRFRLIFAAYSEGEHGKLLGTALSPPIHLVANNDAPQGPAVIPVDLPLDAGWEGWRGPSEVLSPRSASFRPGSFRGGFTGLPWSPNDPASDMGSQRQLKRSSSSDAVDSREHVNELEFIRFVASQSGAIDDFEDSPKQSSHAQIPNLSNLSEMQIPTYEAVHGMPDSSWPMVMPQMLPKPQGPDWHMPRHGSSLMSGAMGSGSSSQTWASSWGSLGGGRMFNLRGPPSAGNAAHEASRKRQEQQELYHESAKRQASAPAFHHAWQPSISPPAQNWNAYSQLPASRESHMFSLPIPSTHDGHHRIESRSQAQMVPGRVATAVAVRNAPNPITSTEAEKLPFNPFAGQPDMQFSGPRASRATGGVESSQSAEDLDLLFGSQYEWK